ncbi:SpoIIE family protein phosphatase [Streptomyces sp. Da 82-17]|uniref:SpoIIE family protein phosphatase n=1 Tax=Streptomyces sp. Da 82-17 TaxID=3377116 RepID=UPI0038D35678
MTTVPKNALAGEPGQRFDLAQTALALLDEQGLVTGWTLTAERLVGYSAEAILNQPVTTLIDTDQHPPTPVEAADKLRAPGGWHGAVTVRRRDGGKLRLVVRTLPLIDPAGSRRWVVLAQDDPAPGWDLGRSMLEPLLTHSPVGVAVLDTDLRYVWANDEMAYGGAVPRGRRVGRRLSEMLPVEPIRRLEEQYRRVLETGVPALNYEYRAPSTAQPDRQHAWWESIFRLEDPAGHVLGVWLMSMDNTERWRAQERLGLLTEASARIGSTLDVVRTAQELADVAVPRFADIVTVDLIETVLRGEEPPAGPIHRAPDLRRAGQRSIHSEYPETVGETDTPLDRPVASPSVRCLMDGRPWTESLTETSPGSWATEDPARAATARELGVHSVLVTPVHARGVRLGVATFLRSQAPDPFDQDDVSLAEELVTRAAVCIDNARRYTHERTAALALQRSLLPRGLATGTVLEVASRYLPANAPHAVGGDWFDVIPLSGARVALVVGDVVGHGANAAITMGRLRAAVRTLADLDLPPDELLAHLDDLAISLLEQEGADAVAEDELQDVASSVLGATCLYAVYDPVTRRCTLARAGHLPPAVVTPDGTVSFPDLPAGPPLGLGLYPFESADLELPDGSLLALYTNGLVERRDQDVDVGLERLADSLTCPARSLDAACDDIVGALLPGPPSDDAALLLARTRGLDADQIASWDLASDPAVVADARDLVARRLADWGMEELQFTTELLVSELVTNAIRYGRDPIRLRLIRRDTLVCEVFDGSNTAPRLRHARTTDEGGRGLFLVAQLSRRWGTRYTTDGKIIWAEQADPATHVTP